MWPTQWFPDARFRRSCLTQGLRLFSVSGSASPGSLGVPFTSTSEQGLLVRFTSASEGDLYLTGFTASFRHMCTTPSGAVAFSDVAALRLRNATIRNNVAAGFGGGVSLRVWPGYSGMRSATATLIGGTLMGNRAIRGGGGLFATSAVALTVAGGTAFASNIVTEGPGGAVYLLSTAVTSSISDARFEANLALADGGGALALDAASVDVRGCTFAANAARDDGGAVLASGGGNVTLAATRFEGNRAAFGGRGGAIAAVNVTSLTARSCAFLRNSVADRPAGSTDTVGGMSSFRCGRRQGSKHPHINLLERCRFVVRVRLASAHAPSPARDRADLLRTTVGPFSSGTPAPPEWVPSRQ